VCTACEYGVRFLPEYARLAQILPDPPDELVGVCVQHVCVRPPRLGNAHRAFEMLTVLLKCSPRVGNARHALEMLSVSARCTGYIGSGLAW